MKYLDITEAPLLPFTCILVEPVQFTSSTKQLLFSLLSASPFTNLCRMQSENGDEVILTKGKPRVKY